MSGHPFSEEFFKGTVEPTVNEYLAQPQDIRRGRLAAIVLEHMVDYWHQDTHEKKDDVRAALRTDTPVKSHPKGATDSRLNGATTKWPFPGFGWVPFTGFSASCQERRNTIS